MVISHLARVSEDMYPLLSRVDADTLLSRLWGFFEKGFFCHLKKKKKEFLNFPSAHQAFETHKWISASKSVQRVGKHVSAFAVFLQAFSEVGF